MADRKVIQFTGTDGNDYDVRDEAAQQKIGTTALPTTAQTLTGAIAEHESDITNQAAEVNSLKSALMLQEETIPDTTQTIVFDSEGNVSSITHQNGSNNTVRADVFTFGVNTITEVRTLYTGETLTIVTNTETLVTTVTYADAA